MNRRAACSILLAAAALPGAARASGFLLHEQSAAALAQGGAAVGSTDEPAAVWFNPAALALHDRRWGAQVTLGLATVPLTFSPAGGGPDTRSLSRVHPVPNLFLHARVLPWLHAGLGINAPFALTLAWPQNWQGAEQAESVRIVVAAINPVLSARLTPRVALAAGGSLLRGDVDYTLALPKEVGGHGALGGNAYTWNANLALSIVLVPDRLRLGFSYRSPVTLDFRGRADFSPADNSLDSTFADQAVRGRLRLPDVASAGLGFAVTSRLRLSVQFDLARWSVFDKLEIVFAEPTTPNQTIARQSQDALTARAGGEFFFPGANLLARGGLFFDQRSVRGGAVAPSAPDSHRLGATAGIGLVRGRFTADLGYLFLHLLPARSNGGDGPAGTYRATAHVLALTVGYRVP